MSTETTPPYDKSMDGRLTRIEDGLADIKIALVGNPKFGHRGLVNRVDTMESKVEHHDRKLLVWGSIITAAVTVATFLKEKIFGQ